MDAESTTGAMAVALLIDFIESATFFSEPDCTIVLAALFAADEDEVVVLGI
jgi:hypothetical protein